MRPASWRKGDLASLKACRSGKDESRDRTNGKVFINIFRTLCLLLGPFFCSNSRVKDFDDSAIKIFILNNIFTSSSKITETSSNAERFLRVWRSRLMWRKEVESQKGSRGRRSRSNHKAIQSRHRNNLLVLVRTTWDNDFDYVIESIAGFDSI